MNNRDQRDNEPRETRSSYDYRHGKTDMSWLVPLIVGLIALGAIAYYLTRGRGAEVSRTTVRTAAGAPTTAGTAVIPPVTTTPTTTPVPARVP